MPLGPMSKKIKSGGDAKSRLAIRQGDSIVLDGGDQRILVRDVKSLGKTKYRGVIFGFSPSFKHEYQGLRVGDDLLFDAGEVLTGLKR